MRNTLLRYVFLLKNKPEQSSEKYWRYACNVCFLGFYCFGLAAFFALIFYVMPGFSAFLLNQQEGLCGCVLAQGETALFFMLCFLCAALPFLFFTAANAETNKRKDFYKDLAFKILSSLGIYIAGCGLLGQFLLKLS